MNIFKNEGIKTQPMNSFQSAFAPILADIGVALVFGLGFYFFKSHFSSSKPREEEAPAPQKPEKDNYKPLREKIEMTINQWDSAISLQKINSIIKRDVNQSNFDPFMILDQLQKNNVNPDISTVNTLLDQCIKLGDFKNFNRLCELIIDSENYMISNMPAPNIVTFNIILKGLILDMCKLEMEERKKFYAPAKVEFILKEILGRNLKPNDITLNTVIDMMVESCSFTQAWKYYEEMEKEYSIEPDIFTYSTLLKSIKNYEPEFENVEKAFEILRIVRLSKTKGIKPDEILYNCILETCVKYNKMEQAEVVFNDMKEALVTPSKITYAIMIKGFGNQANLEKCFILFYEMKQFNLEPNEIIYGCILNACVKANNIYKACELFNEIKNYSNISMNIYLYTTLIKGYTRCKNFEKAFELYNQMLEDQNVKPNIIVYNAILDCCVECFDIEMMKKIYEDLRQKAIVDESFPQPDLITYTTVIKGYSKIKDSSKVLDIYYYLCGRDDLKLDEIIFCSVLDALLKTERLDEALAVYNNMLKLNIQKSNASYSILIKIFSKLNDVETAVEIYNEMISAKIQPSLITYTSIIQILIKSKRITNGIQIFEEILSNNIKPDQVLFNVIINGCVLNGRLEEGCKFLLESFKAEIRVCYDVYNNVLSNLLTNKILDPIYKNELTMKICQEMTYRGVQIDFPLYERIIKMISRKNSNNANYTNYDNYHNNNNNYYKYNYEKNFNGNANKQYNRTKNIENESILDEGQSIYDVVAEKKNYKQYEKRPFNNNNSNTNSNYQYFKNNYNRYNNNENQYFYDNNTISQAKKFNNKYNNYYGNKNAYKPEYEYEFDN